MTRRADAVPVAIAKQIDALCDRFEADWNTGQEPRIEDVLGSLTGPARDELLFALLSLELELTTRRGPRPDPADYRARFPEHTGLVEKVFRFQGLEATNRMRAGGGSTSVGIDSVADGGRKRTVGVEGQTEAVFRTIGRFEVMQVLGQGAFGKVYRARDPQLDREVAVKVPLAGSVETDLEKERFLREARAAATVHHPNICPVYEVGQDGSQCYIVMAYVVGKSLATHLKEKKEPLPDKQAAVIVRKLALALEVAHAKGVIHRDLKPANIMIDRDRKDVVIMDFGLARRKQKEGDARLTLEGMIMGTPAYMAPEQARGDVQAVGPASDVYSLGVILYEMLAGRLPFTGSIMEVFGQVLHVEPEPPSKHRPTVDARLEAVCLKAMAKEPARRYASMRELAAALNEYLKGAAVAPAIEEGQKGDTAAAVEHALTRQRVPLGKWLAGFGVMAGLVSVLIVAVIIVVGGPNPEITEKEAPFGAPAPGNKDDLPADKPSGMNTADTPPGAWVSLFNGKDLTGWVVDGDLEAFRIEEADSAIVAKGTRPGRSEWLLTNRDFTDFVFRCEFQQTEHSFSGIALRALPEPNTEASNNFKLKMQIHDDNYPAYHRTGAVKYLGPNSVGPDQRAKQRPLGEWNTLEIHMLGSVVRTFVNGDKTLETDLDKIERTKLANKPWAIANLSRKSGRLGFEAEKNTVKFRKVEVKEISPANP